MAPPTILRADPTALALAAIPVAGSAAAVFLDADSRATVIFLAAVSLACAAMGLWRVRRRLGACYEIGAAVFQFGMIFWFFAPAITTAFSSDQWRQRAALIEIDNTHAVHAFLAVSLFFFGFCLAYQLLRSAALARLQMRVLGTAPVASPARAARFLIIAAIGSLAFYIIVSGGVLSAFDYIIGSRTVQKPWDSEGNYGTELSPFHFLFSSILIAVSAFSFHLVLSVAMPKRERVVLASLAVFATLTVAVESGTRSSLILCVIPAVLVFYRRQIGAPKRGRASAGFIVAAFVLAALVAANLQRTYRSTGTVDESVDFGVKDNDFFTATAYSVAINRREKLTYESPFIHIVTGPIPRVLWRGKPELESMPVYSRYIWGYDIKERGRNTLPSIVGQYLLSWGWIGVLEIGLWLGLLISAGDQAFAGMRENATGRLAYAAVATYFFVVFRTIGFFFVMPVVCVVILSRILGPRRRLRKSVSPAVL